MFERYYRVHYNTLEQLIIFLPGLWLFGFYIGYSWAAGIGLIYLVGRVIYGVAYIKDPGSRGIGMILSVLPCWVLILGGLVGATWSLIVG
jgi:glutathione S-transferase